MNSPTLLQLIKQIVENHNFSSNCADSPMSPPQKNPLDIVWSSGGPNYGEQYTVRKSIKKKEK